MKYIMFLLAALAVKRIIYPEKKVEEVATDFKTGNKTAVIGVRG